jgi:Ni/Fe-hydrogenase subunit HybB-like protein
VGADGLQNTPPIGPKVVLGPGHTYATITDKISAIVLTQKTKRGWWGGLLVGLSLLGLLHLAIGVLLTFGVRVWGINIPVGWGFAIVNFVWWIGIGHAGTLISAFLLLMRQEWRQSINRFAEAMTLFAVACAGMFPLLHMGRPWLFFWMMPYPDTMGTWPQFRSPLVWDVFAVSTYGTISLLFWFVGLIPDLATLRDRARRTPFPVLFTAGWPWVGADRPDTGIATKWLTCCWPDWQRPSWFPSTRS